MHVQQLERRRLFAVTVSMGYPGFYEIHGDANANSIIVSVNMDELSFTFDGNTYYDVEHIGVYGYGGDDSIHLSSEGYGYIGASILGGDGDDILSLTFDGAIWGEAGSDTIFLTNSFRGVASGGGGNDEIVIAGDCIDAEIRGGDGNDLIDARNNNYRVVIFGDAGDDTIHGSQYDDLIYGGTGTDTVYGYAGNDTFFSSEYVDGGDGYDILYRTGGDVYTGIEELFYG